MAESLKIGVIGGGLGGLASACVLAARGHKVTLFDKNPWLGGKAAVLEEKGFRFDMGPTILTVPSVLKRIFAEAGKRMEDYLDLVYLDPQWRCFFDDGSVLDLEANVEKMAARLDVYSPNSGEGYKRFIEYSKRLHAISERFYFYKSIGGIKDMFEWKTSFQAKMLGDVLSMRMGRSVASTVRKYVPNANAAQMLDHFTQYVGSCPESSPAVLCSIAHMQTSEGVWYPRGGTRAVPVALTKLANELGVDLRPGVEVTRILTDDRESKVTSLQTASGEKIAFDRIVSNSDTVRTHRELLDGVARARKFENRRSYEPACSGVVLYLGLDKRYEQLLHHGFIFSRDPHVEFDEIYRQGEPAKDPTCYIAAPAITEPEVAPPGGEALYVLVHTPYLRPHHDWSKMLLGYRKTILEKLERTAGMKDLEKHIVFESALTPQGIHDRYKVLNGAIYGLASHGLWNGAFKPANRSPDFINLYLAGGSAHPGPGMPMALMSGWIAGDVCDRDAA